MASSPDEVALVKFVDGLGHKLTHWDESKIVLSTINNTEEEYQVLANFPFSSDTKRMGIIVRHLASGLLVFYLKGAEVVVEDKVW